MEHFSLKTLDIKKMELNELKALGFDLVKQRDMIINNLGVVNNEIERRERREQLKKLKTNPKVRKGKTRGEAIN